MAKLFAILPILRPEQSYRVCVCVCVSVCVSLSVIQHKSNYLHPQWVCRTDQITKERKFGETKNKGNL